MTSCHYPTPRPERDRMYQHKVSLVVRYFMIPCNICLILLATSTLGFAVLLFLNNCSKLTSQMIEDDTDKLASSSKVPQFFSLNKRSGGILSRRKPMAFTLHSRIKWAD
ncbi:agrin isoform X3 [Tachysurus ichikawai]